jgi:hypothetical protein
MAARGRRVERAIRCRGVAAARSRFSRRSPGAHRTPCDAGARGERSLAAAPTSVQPELLRQRRRRLRSQQVDGEATEPGWFGRDGRRKLAITRQACRPRLRIGPRAELSLKGDGAVMVARPIDRERRRLALGKEQRAVAVRMSVDGRARGEGVRRDVDQLAVFGARDVRDQRRVEGFEHRRAGQQQRKHRRQRPPERRGVACRRMTQTDEHEECKRTVRSARKQGMPAKVCGCRSRFREEKKVDK